MAGEDWRLENDTPKEPSTPIPSPTRATSGVSGNGGGSNGGGLSGVIGLLTNALANGGIGSMSGAGGIGGSMDGGMDSLVRNLMTPRPQTALQQFGGVLQGLSAPLMGQPDPRIAQQDQEIRQKLQALQVQQNVNKQRAEQNKVQIELAKSMLETDSPEARKLGGQWMAKLYKDAGGPDIGNLAESLAAPKALSLDRRKDLYTAIRVSDPSGRDDAAIAARFGLEPTQMSQYRREAFSDEAHKLLYGKTAKQMDLEEREKTQKLAQEDMKRRSEEMKLRFPEYESKSLVPYLVQEAWSKYGKDYTELDGPTRAKVLQSAQQRMDEHKIAEAAAKKGATAGEGIQRAPAGAVYYDRRTRQEHAQIKGSEGFELMPDGSPRWVEIGRQEQDVIKLFETRGKPTVEWLKQYTPMVLASVAGKPDLMKNLVKAIQNKATTFAGASPLVSKWLAALTDASIENTRALGGTAAIRIQLLQIIQKDISPSLRDSQQQAVAKLDSIAVNMENTIRGYHHETPLPFGAVQGPGKYLVRDKRDNQLKTISVPKGVWTPDYYEVIEPQ